MDQRVDVFAGFVTALSGALDEHETTSADLARRAHLSRYHFDRMISAIAGEAPGRFRRRVLLERAAYRLLTSELPIVDVAIEAGYSSHQAFTRAFTRAYGRAPAEWRTRPTQIELDAPTHVHFHPPGSLRLPADGKATSMDLIGRMLDHHIWLVGEMLARAAELDDARLDAPIEISVEGIDDEPTLRSLLARLVGQLAMWDAWLAGRDYDWSQEREASIADLRRRLGAAGADFSGRVRDLCEQGRLDDALVCPGEQVEVYTYGGMLAHVLTFAAYRRTLAAGALHDFGFTDLDSGDPIRWIGAPG